MRRAAAAVALIVLAVGGVAFAQSLHRRTRPTVHVTSALLAGGKLRFGLDVSFAAPTGLRGGSPCRGRVVARARGHRWSARVQRAARGCHAQIAGRLSGSLAGRTISFRIRFRGNASVAGFSVRRRVKLSTQVIPKPLNTPPPG
jgi:hypothetical protein